VTDLDYVKNGNYRQLHTPV